jgi:hypothetical protein
MAGGESGRPMNMKEDQARLDRALQEWKMTIALPAHFQEQVWKRIERTEVPGISLVDVIRAWFTLAFARPAFAIAYVSVLLVAGLAIGFAQASAKAADWDRQLEAQYVQSIDPYQRIQP